MAPVEVKVDYYTVLELSNTANLKVRTKTYRRLAEIRHPHKNPDKEDSTAVVQLISLMTFQISKSDRR